MINIAIDGPSGAGKSTVARAVAAKLDILYLDTGAMYRACGLYAVRKGKNPADYKDAVGLLSEINVDVEYEGGRQITLLNGEDVSDAVRAHEISKAASDISKHPEVRMKLVEMQRKIASKTSVVLDGRDIGTYVLPECRNKFYLTASPEIRAQRRYKELSAKGAECDYATILADIIQRDYNDSHRDFAPLRQAADAVFIDSGEMTPEEVRDFILARLKY